MGNHISPLALAVVELAILAVCYILAIITERKSTK
jgi:hypothetical protein